VSTFQQVCEVVMRFIIIYSPSHAYQKLRMTMPQAYVTLREKNCLFTSDRLAMLSNLAHYPYRIKTDRVVRELLGFSACIIAIALHNGDLSPLFCENPSSSSNHTAMAATGMASWLPSGPFSIDNLLTIYNMPTHSFFGTRIPTGDRCLVLNEKLIIKGLLWDIEPFHGFSILSEEVSQLQKPGGKAAGPSSRLLLRQLINRCLQLGRKDILELIITTALPRQFTSPAEIFQLMDELGVSYHQATALSEHHIGESGLPVDQTFTVRPRAIAAKDPLPESPSGNRLIKWIYNSISSDLPLAMGTCKINQESEKPETLISFFSFDPAKHRTVFSPLSELEYEFGESSFVHLEPKSSFWCVSACGTYMADAEMQTARTKLDIEEDRLNLSDQILKIERTPAKDGMQAVWSPRLSRTGMHMQDPDTKSWNRVPLGKGIYSPGFFMKMKMKPLYYPSKLTSWKNREAGRCFWFC
jgi:hypothetical protein